MNYPNKKNTSIKRNKISAANRGMSLEDDLNATNQAYLNQDIAIIHKKPTPITVVKVDYPKRSAATITEAYFKLPSTTDYNGIYKAKYIDFEAKECHSTTSFPFSSISQHQINHLDSVRRHGAVSFIILRMCAFEEDYLIKSEDFISYCNLNKRKSLPYTWIKENGHLIPSSLFKPCDYLKVIDTIFDL